VSEVDKNIGAQESFVWEIADNGDYEVRTERGPVIEKAGVMTVTTRVEQPPFIIGGRWNRFIEVAVHPQTPLVGMLHATFSVQVSEAGVGNIGATMDMMQSAQPPEDLELLRNRVTEVFVRHEMNPDKYRPHGCGEPNKGFWKWHRAGTCTGVSLYGQQFLADEKTFALVSELYTTVIKTYFEILAQRQAEPYGEAELAKQDFMRRRWLEDQLYWDVLAKNFVPYEAWSAVNGPPVVKF
jgi:coproporphyrinogen III oxidase